MNRLEKFSGSELSRGDQFSKYSLLERIGRGGEATVWSAWDNQRQRILALKIMAKAEEGNGKDALRISRNFEHQIHLIASLNHPNILPLYEFGETSRFYYFAMHYTCAGSLANRLSEAKLDLREILQIGAQIATALQYLHDHKIVHRDLKPSNILMDSQDRLYLSDFGLSKQLSLETVPLHTGRGTGPYAPYEQFAHLEVSAQSDIFSFGVLMYEMFSGNLPWGGSDSLAVQQSQNFVELPDVVCDLQELCLPLTEVLRQWTAFHPYNRPESVREAFEMLTLTITGIVGGENLPPLTTTVPSDENWILGQDAVYLLERYRSTVPSTIQAPLASQASGETQSFPDNNIFPSSLTHLALIDSALRPDRPFALEMDDDLCGWILNGALVYDYNLDKWQRIVQDRAIRQRACLNTLMVESEEAAARALQLLLSDLPDGPIQIDANPLLIDRLVDWSIYGQTWSIREDALLFLERVLTPSKEWKPVAISSGRDLALAALALENNPLALRAARIIGKLHSTLAVENIVRGDEPQQNKAIHTALAAIQESAGSLPPVLPARLQLAIRLQRIWNSLQEERQGIVPIHGLIGLVVGLLVAIVMGLRLFYPIHAALQDVLYQPAPVSNIITLIEINDASLEQFGRWSSWPRELHARLIEQLDQAGVQAIVLDYLLGEAAAGDDTLAQAMRQAGTVVQPVLGEGDAYLDTMGEVRYIGRVLPTSQLLASGAAVGYTNVLHDPDGLVRRMPLMVQSGGETNPNIILAALQVYLKNAGQMPEQTNTSALSKQLAFAGRQIPVGDHAEMWINYAGPPAQANTQTFHTVSFQEVLEGKAPPEWLKGKIVIVGMTATAEPDRYLTPISQGRPMYGLEILANAIETIWSGRFIRLPDFGLRLVILLVLSLVAGLLGVHPWRGLAFTVGLALVYFLAASWIFDWTGILFDLLYPFMAIALGYAASAGYRYSMVDRRYRGISEALESRVAQQTNRSTMEALYHGEIGLEQKVQEVTVLVVELRHLSEAAAQLEPAQASGLIDRLQDIFSQAILKYEGTIVNGVGEQLTAVFNTPLPQTDHPGRAAWAALIIKQQVGESLALSSAGPTGRPVRASAGIYTGRAVIGYTRFGRRRQLIVMGEPVQIATQLSQLAQPNQILLAGQAYTALEHEIQVEAYEPFFLKEQKASIMTYALIEAHPINLI